MNGKLDTCHCCEGLTAQTPVAVTNLPGLSAIAYRVGTHSQFKQSMLAALSDITRAALQGLQTRDDDDFSIALLDASATMADVLTFYQERIANESYLRTATERRSLLELARLIGYELRPGVAASAFLAFTMDEAPGAPPETTVDVGTKVQSIPGPDEKAQTFETIEKITARVEWNAIKPRQSKLTLPVRGDTSIWLRGAATNLKAGDLLLLVGREREKDPTNDNWDVRRITAVEADHDRDLLRVTWQPGLGSETPFKEPSANPRVYVLRQRASLFGHNAPDWDTLPATLRFGEWVYVDETTVQFKPGAFAGRQSSWTDAPLPSTTQTIWLDAVYPTVTQGSRIVLSSPDYTELYRVSNVSEESHTDFNLSAKVTRFDISGENIQQFSPRNCGVYIQSEELELAESPVDEPVRGGQIVIAGEVIDPGPSRKLAASGKRAVVEAIGKGEPLSFVRPDGTLIRQLNRGERLFERQAQPLAGGQVRWQLLDENLVEGFVTCGSADVVRIVAGKDDPVLSEIVELATLDGDDPFHSRVNLREPLQNVYDRQSFRLCANVAHATHGETVSEVLGSGDASQRYQQFILRQPPLTYRSAATASGASSTLQVRVDDLLWHEAPTLFGRGSQEQIYVTRTGDDGKTTIEFGDGVTGARLPSGQDNVRATYRKGIGVEGLVKAGQLTSLLTRPLGIKSLANPEEATGAQDRESLDDARTNAPLTVLTLDRTVSLQDYEDFSRAFAGIAKALAT
jgi:hypothetical protein